MLDSLGRFFWIASFIYFFKYTSIVTDLNSFLA